jgi:lysophospholipase L1-like esterase
MIQRRVSHLLRMAALSVFVFSCVFLFTPSAFAATRSTAQATSVGPKTFYMALGDSLAFGFQPNLDFTHGYADYFYQNLKSHGTKYAINLGCNGETSTSMINGTCPLPALRKYPYTGAQLSAAVTYLHLYAGHISPVTLDIGANDIDQDTNSSTCVINTAQFNSDLATLDYNLTHVILPQLVAAMTIDGRMTGDLLMMNYYDPLQNKCPNTVPYVQTLNAHIQADAQGYAQIVDVFDAFGGASVPNPNICTYTWICSNYTYLLGIHATDTGYGVIANTFEQTASY